MKHLGKISVSRLRYPIHNIFLGKSRNMSANGYNINAVLEYVAKHFKADRAYVFESDLEKKVFNNTYEWVRTGMSAEIDNLQNKPQVLVPHFQYYLQ